jgi:cellulose 1,4-beta-cellobiosidase
MYSKLAAITALLATARAQQVCTLTTETHPSMAWKKCASGGTCTNVAGQVVIDANWRWTHSTSAATNCYTGNKWDATLCPSNDACAKNCCLDGAQYASTYGASTSGDALSLGFVTKGSTGTNVGSRLYLMESETKYQMFTLAGNEFTFDVDVSQLGCGLNGALYFVSMDADGGLSKEPNNKAGAKYGTGYCDSQCPRDLKFIGGTANVEGWQSSTVSANSGVGGNGACCAEMDIWESNSISQALTPHPCKTNSLTVCKGEACGGTYSADRYAGTCDPDGCDINPYRIGHTDFYGPGSNFKLDTTKKMTVVTQFPASGSSVTAIRRFYIQNGVRFEQPNALNIPGYTGNEISSAYCAAEEAEFGGSSFSDKGGLPQMSDALTKGMVLVMSIWDDYGVNMLWLDSTYPVDDPDKPGAKRGSCPTDSGKPADIEANSPNSKVIYSNIRFGPIGSTTNLNTPGDGGSSSSSSTTARTTSTTSRTSTTTGRTTMTTSTTTQGGNTPTQTKYGQCGGNGFTGPTACVSGSQCQKLNDWYYQCL